MIRYIKTTSNGVNQKTLIIIIVVIILGVGGYFYWDKIQKTNPGTSALEKIGEAAKKITDSVTKGVLPSIQTNPLENKPDLNPADKANPYKNIKTNPFE